MVTSAVLYHVMNFFHITIDIRNVCVFLAPLFSSFTTLVTYHLTKELKVGCPRFYNYRVITKLKLLGQSSFVIKIIVIENFLIMQMSQLVHHL